MSRRRCCALRARSRYKSAWETSQLSLRTNQAGAPSCLGSPSDFCYVVSNRPELMPAQQRDVVELRDDIAEIKRYLRTQTRWPGGPKPRVPADLLLLPTLVSQHMSTRQRLRLASVLVAGALAGGLVASGLIPSDFPVPLRLLLATLAIPAFGTALAAFLALLEGDAYDKGRITEGN